MFTQVRNIKTHGDRLFLQRKAILLGFFELFESIPQLGIVVRSFNTGDTTAEICMNNFLISGIVFGLALGDVLCAKCMVDGWLWELPAKLCEDGSCISEKKLENVEKINPENPDVEMGKIGGTLEDGADGELETSSHRV